MRALTYVLTIGFLIGQASATEPTAPQYRPANGPGYAGPFRPQPIGTSGGSDRMSRPPGPLLKSPERRTGAPDFVTSAFGNDLDAGDISPAQYQSNSRFPNRGVDGMLRPGGRNTPQDPTSAFERDLRPGVSPPPAYGDGERTRSYLKPDTADDLLQDENQDDSLYASPMESQDRLVRDASSDSASAGSGIGAARGQAYIPASATPRTNPSTTTPRTRPLEMPSAQSQPAANQSTQSYPPASQDRRGQTLTPPPITSPAIRNSTPMRSAPSTSPMRTHMAQSNPVSSSTPNPAQAVRQVVDPMRQEVAETAARLENRGYLSTLMMLFASIGLNLYLGWIAWDTYNRYQDLVGDIRYSNRSNARDRSERRLAEAY